MQKIIGVTEIQRNFRTVFDEVAKEHIPYVLTRGSRPEAALIPYEAFLRRLELQEQEVLSRFDRLAARIAVHNEAYAEEEIAADVAAAVAEARARPAS
jgi:prevent-host-death family protein